MAEVERIYPSENYDYLPYFRSVWKKERLYNKVRNEPLFKKCGEFERLSEALHAASTQERDITEFLSQKDSHNTFVVEKGRTWRLITELS